MADHPNATPARTMVDVWDLPGGSTVAGEYTGRDAIGRVSDQRFRDRAAGRFGSMSSSDQPGPPRNRKRRTDDGGWVGFPPSPS